jgi:DNA primase
MREARADVQAIKDRIDVLSVVSRYLSLTKSGTNYKGHCPFHKDDTPSFMINPEKGLWHCFGCGEGGDVFSFLMKVEKIDFLEAAKRLAEEVGLPFQQRANGERERLQAINVEVANYFANNLADSAAGRKAREYLVGRGYGKEVWGKYGLGYAFPGWDHLKDHFAKRYGEETLVHLGLLVAGQGGTYDRFRDRVVFAIHDLSGRPNAFGGRAFEGEPKYLNSPNSVLFDKGKQLYGLFWAREALAEKRVAILVEGYTDVLTLHLAGITNVVGSMGTALTQEQAALLSRFVEEVIIAYDRDTAGGAASLRGMNILYGCNLAVRVARLPEGDDPDSVVRREGKQALLSTLEAAMPFHLFYIESLKERHDLSTLAGREGVLMEARSFYQGILSLPLKREVAHHVAGLLDLPLEAVMRDLARRPHQRMLEELIPVKPSWGEEEVILWLLLNGQASWADIAELTSSDDFSEKYRPIVEVLAAGCDPSSLSLYLDEETKRQASSVALRPVVFSDVQKALRDALTKLVKLPQIEKKLAVLREEMKKTADGRRLDELQKSYSALVAEKLSRRGKTDGED